jgi:hypothetical protein
MRGKGQLLTLFLLIMIAGGSLTVLVMRAQTQQGARPLRDTGEEKARAFPIVDFDEPEPIDKDVREKRQARSKRYDKYSGQRIEQSNISFARVASSDWADRLTAVPVAESDAVVTCMITHAAAHLSNDKTAVYSEFDCRVNDVLKSQRTLVSVGDIIVLQRYGGIVRFRNGTTFTIETVGQGMPATGQQHVFFLKGLGEERDFRIITGYEVSGPEVTPLDGSISDEGTRRYPFDQYRGYDPTSFLKIVREAVQQSGN